MRTMILWDPDPYDTFQAAIAPPEMRQSFRYPHTPARTGVADIAGGCPRTATRPMFRQIIPPMRTQAARPRDSDTHARDMQATSPARPPVASPRLDWIDGP